MRRVCHFRLLLVVALAVAGLDQASKLLADGRAPVVLVPGLLTLHAVPAAPEQLWDAGVLAHLPEALRGPLGHATATLAALGFLVAFWSRLPRGALALRTALAAVVGGVLGNGVDRLVRGAPLNLVELPLRALGAGGGGRAGGSGANLADVALFLGGAVLLVEALRSRTRLLPDAGARGAPSHP